MRDYLCQEPRFAALLDPFVDGELPEEEAARVRAHLETCEECRRYVEDALLLRACFPEAEETEAPEGFRDRLLAALPDRETTPEEERTGEENTELRREDRSTERTPELSTDRGPEKSIKQTPEQSTDRGAKRGGRGTISFPVLLRRAMLPAAACLLLALARVSVRRGAFSGMGMAESAPAAASGGASVSSYSASAGSAASDESAGSAAPAESNGAAGGNEEAVLSDADRGSGVSGTGIPESPEAESTSEEPAEAESSREQREPGEPASAPTAAASSESARKNGASGQENAVSQEAEEAEDLLLDTGGEVPAAPSPEEAPPVRLPARYTPLLSGFQGAETEEGVLYLLDREDYGALRLRLLEEGEDLPEEPVPLLLEWEEE